MLSIALLSKMTARCGHKTARCGYETPVRERRNKGRVKSGLRAGRSLLALYRFIIAKATMALAGSGNKNNATVTKASDY